MDRLSVRRDLNIGFIQPHDLPSGVIMATCKQYICV